MQRRMMHFIFWYDQRDSKTKIDLQPLLIYSVSLSLFVRLHPA